MGGSTGWLDGEVRVEVTGERLEPFINLVVVRGIELWDMRRTDGTVTFWLRAADFRRLRPIVRKTRCRVHITDRRGLPFSWKRFSRRRSSVLGVLLCIALVVFSSSFIWTVEVEGLQERHPQVVLDAARELGLAPGVYIYRLDLNRAARELARELPFITWVGIERRGVRLTIKVLEKVEERPEIPGPVDIVARSDGVVEEILVLSGAPVVAAGDVVAEGTVLIRSSPAVEDRPAISARGRVLASVWYTAVEWVALSQEVAVPTGRELVRTEIVTADGRTLRVQGRGEVPFERYETVEWSWTPFSEWRKPPLLVEVRRVYYKELSTYLRRLTEAEAAQIACSGGNHRIREQLPPDAEVTAVRCDMVSRGDNHVEVEVTVFAREDIGRQRPASGR
ncbi:MAG: sporulation protein YqfD [Bacillota bacterium]